MNRAILLAVLGTIAVFMACTNVQSAKETPRISKEELRAKLGSPDLVLIDVRTRKDWDMSSDKITGAIRMDPEAFDDWAGTLAKEKEIVLYCSWLNEGTSARVAEKLIEKGYNAKALKGGWKEWLGAKYPVEKK